MKMKPLNIFCFISLLALECNIIRSCFAGSYIQLPGSEWSVVIFNYQKDPIDLVVHCKSKDDDLGEHIIRHGGQYNWSFKENFWRTTLFWCNFWSKYGHASGQVFWPETQSWLSSRCENNICAWVAAGDDGISLANLPTKEIELIYRWGK